MKEHVTVPSRELYFSWHDLYKTAQPIIYAAATLLPFTTMGSQSPTNANDRPRLTEAQKKENHIRSEQKRREAIREGFDRLASIVPGMEGQGRSEAVVLEATIKYMREKIVERQKIMADAQAQGIDTSAWDLPKETLDACNAQLQRTRDEEAQMNGTSGKS